ncbi:MAG TPA: hypothetical protein VGO56_14975 [Pyrinomonadaceae bacterium]|jgi:hypothetical protein|nr:hypothetical protein [Pyrinomonadaceae bacterium]
MKAYSLAAERVLLRAPTIKHQAEFIARNRSSKPGTGLYVALPGAPDQKLIP